jgi:RNA polymerase sigma-70 factor (ECF subfamily)
MGTQREIDREDRRCLARLARGETDALEAIYDRHAQGMFGHALWVLGRRADAEDAVQAVFVELAGLGAALLGIRRPGAYLRRMVHREAIDQHRRRGRRREEGGEQELLELAGDPGDAHRAESVLLGRGLSRLDATQREVVYLHVWAGLTFREVGAVTGVSTFTAASRYRLALGRLRRELGEG